MFTVAPSAAANSASNDRIAADAWNSAFSSNTGRQDALGMSFADTLAAFQTETSTASNGTTAVLEQFQMGTTFRNPFGQSQPDANSGNSELETTADRDASSQSASTTGNTSQREDEYVAAGTGTHENSSNSRIDEPKNSTDTGSKSTGTKQKSRNTTTPGTHTAEPAADTRSGAQDASVQTPSSSPASSTTSASGTASGPVPSATITTPGSGSRPANQDVAFAVRIQSGTPSTPAATSDPVDQSQATNNVQASPFAADLQAAVLEQTSSKTGAGAMPSIGSISPATIANPKTEAETNPEASDAASDTSTTEEITKAMDAVADPKGAVPAVKSVQVQINDGDGQRVDLRMMERSGVLTMSVRSADGTLNQQLQQHLPDLTTKLSDSSIKAEWWTPATSDSPAASTAEPKSTDTGGGRQQSFSDNSSNTGQNSGGNSGQSGRRPHWVEELTQQSKSNNSEVYQIWHQ